MSDGKPVLFLFIGVIIYRIGSYGWQLREENARLHRIATDQDEVIKELTARQKDLKDLIDVMFGYMETQQQMGPYLKEQERKNLIH